MKVLIVDDDQYFAEPLIWELRERGYEVETCGAIEDVLSEDKKIRINKLPDCVILDIMMPHGEIFTKQETNRGAETGLRLLNIIHKEWPNVPVIIVTVRDDITLPGMKKQFGDTVRRIFLKPTKPSEIVQCLRELTDKEQV